MSLDFQIHLVSKFIIADSVSGMIICIADTHADQPTALSLPQIFFASCMDNANLAKGLKRAHEWWIFLEELAKRGPFCPLQWHSPSCKQ